MRLRFVSSSPLVFKPQSGFTLDHVVSFVFAVDKDVKADALLPFYAAFYFFFG